MPIEKVIEYFTLAGVHAQACSETAVKIYSVHFTGHIMYYPTTGKIVKNAMKNDNGRLNGVDNMSVAQLAEYLK